MNHIKRLECDLRDVAVWLDAIQPERNFALSVDLNFTADENILSHIVVASSVPEVRRELRARATQAMVALGYTVAPTGGDVYDVMAAPRRELSAHQRIRCYRRVSRALDGDYQAPFALECPRPSPDATRDQRIDDNF